MIHNQDSTGQKVSCPFQIHLCCWELSEQTLSLITYHEMIIFWNACTRWWLMKFKQG